ncbi:hypothetical protein NDU88_006309 [Pleurodeles waltl]|uniref:Uncharacterized protein n=1 Tax=Pleurodeles waltl TaxID=8319 RepID=A0AAV7QNL0_PLEWA|nr:hypothetical protein NDU88_006309 [Pleurodeles waltl]
MEEDQVVEQQDDLERMIAHMRAEALKRGNDWLRAKMEEKGEEIQSQDLSAPALPTLADETGVAGGISPPPQKVNKRQRTEGKPARKTTKKARDMVLTTEEHTTASPASGILRAPAEGEHISAIIKECFKSLASLLLRGNGAGTGTEGIAPISGQSGTQAASKERLTLGDPCQPGARQRR